MNGYNLTRNWYNFKFENPKKVRHIHSDMYFYIIDLWNRLGQKNEFGLPTSVTMEALGIGSYNTYKKCLNDLFDFGFIRLVKDSNNQHHSKVITLSKTDKPTDKPLDKATIKATDKPLDKATDSIDKQINKEQKNKEQKKNKFDFKKSLIDLGVDENIVDDYIIVRKNKRLSNTETAFKKIKDEIIKSKRSANDVISICVEKSWGGFNHKWLDEITDVKTVKRVYSVDNY